MKKIVILVLIFLCFSFLNFGLINYNGSKYFPALSPSAAQEMSIVNGSTNLLKAQANILLYLAEYESSELGSFDCDLSKKYISSAIEYAKTGAERYLEALAILKNTDTSISMNFDYDKIRDNFSIKSVFDDIILYYKAGEYPKLFGEHISILNEQTEVLKTINKDLLRCYKTDIGMIRKLQDKINYLIIAGDYASRINSYISDWINNNN